MCRKPTPTSSLACARTEMDDSNLDLHTAPNKNDANPPTNGGDIQQVGLGLDNNGSNSISTVHPLPVQVKGSWGSKINAVVQTVLEVLANQNALLPPIKLLIFSGWQEVLSVVAQALKANTV